MSFFQIPDPKTDYDFSNFNDSSSSPSDPPAKPDLPPKQPSPNQPTTTPLPDSDSDDEYSELLDLKQLTHIIQGSDDSGDDDESSSVASDDSVWDRIRAEDEEKEEQVIDPKTIKV